MAGLSYQAVEMAATLLIEMVNGTDPGDHLERRARASELMRLCRKELDDLWEARNIDFYGNVSPGRPRRRMNREEARESLDQASRLIEKVRFFVNEGLGTVP